MRRRHAFGMLVCGLLAGCATHAPAGTAQACDVSWVEGSGLSPVRACELRVLARRCAVSDQCQIRCEAVGGAQTVAGGCAHVCSGGVQTGEDIARNGGTFATQESVACYNDALKAGLLEAATSPPR